MDAQPLCVVTLRDETGSSGYMRVSVAASTGADVALSALWELAGLLSVGSDAAPVSVSVTYKTVVSEGRGAAGSDVGRQLVLVLGAAGDGEYAVVNIPGAPADMFGPDGGAVDGDTRVAALAAALISGPWCNPFGADIVSLETAFRGDTGE